MTASGRRIHEELAGRAAVRLVPAAICTEWAWAGPSAEGWWFMTRGSLVRPFFVALMAVGLTTVGSAGEVEVDRLATLARVWASVKYLHPVILQKEIDWDGALVRAIPGARGAAKDDDFARTVESMLKELGDPATRVVQQRRESRAAHDVALVRWVGDVLVIGAGPYAEAKTGMALWGDIAALSKEITKAKQVIIDLRFHPQNPDERGMAASVVSELRGLVSEVVVAPASVAVFHSGYTPQQGTTSGGYFSGLLTIPGEAFRPSAAPSAPSRVLFVSDADSAIPPLAIALHDAGKALIVSDAPLGDHLVVNTKTIELGEQWRALIRLQTMSVSIAADVIAADPMTEALAIANGAKSAPSARRFEAGAPVAEPRWRPDPDYKDMTYPDLPHRLLAAFRIWSVIEYFYPYKALIGDWDAALTDSIPQFIAAANEDDYAKAVLQMVARVEDGHSRAYGHRAAARLLGTWRLPLDVRQVEGQFTVVSLQAALPADADVRVGDVVMTVDGEALGARVQRVRQYVTASTDIARTNRATSVALMAEKAGAATVTLRGIDGRARSVEIPRSQGFQPRATGEPYRIIDKTIGYVDLTRLTVSQVDAMFEALKSTTAIIFDMRGYPNGTAWSIAPRINTKGAKVGAVFRRAQVSGVTSFEESASGFFFEQPLPTATAQRYAGKTVMLIDDRAISQSEHTALFFEAANGTTFIGTPTAGANGDVTNFSLPGGFLVNFSGHDVRHADGGQLQRVGIQPHIRVAPTINGLQAGRDEVLERAIAFLKDGK
jgi:C-terminal processing protease CtpA/Prc